MLSEAMQKALNDQINAEIHSSYIYYAMSAYFESLSLTGFAHWMRVQALEELAHAQKFFAYIHERGGKVELKPIGAVPAEWESPLAAFENAYEHECYISGRINKLVDLAIEEHDHATYNFLQWFVEEQVEEEASADEMVQRLRLVGTPPEGDMRGGGLFMLDRDVAQRAFHLPTGMTY